jgi:hypothetical protein
VTDGEPGVPGIPGGTNRPEREKVSDVSQGNGIEIRLRQAAGLPEALAAGFNAFEAIRMAARGYQDQVPELFAAFMTTADAAVDGREALTVAPSLPLDDGTERGIAVPGGSDADQAADVLAALAAVLRDRLADAAALADTPGDRAACQEAAAAAGRICQLMTR